MRYRFANQQAAASRSSAQSSRNFMSESGGGSYMVSLSPCVANPVPSVRRRSSRRRQETVAVEFMVVPLEKIGERLSDVVWRVGLLQIGQKRCDRDVVSVPE